MRIQTGLVLNFTRERVRLRWKLKPHIKFDRYPHTPFYFQIIWGPLFFDVEVNK